MKIHRLQAIDFPQIFKSIAQPLDFFLKVRTCSLSPPHQDLILGQRRPDGMAPGFVQILYLHVSGVSMDRTIIRLEHKCQVYQKYTRYILNAEGWDGKVFSFLLRHLSRHGITLVTMSGTNVAPLLFLGTQDSLCCFDLMEMYQLYFPFQIKTNNSICSTSFLFGNHKHSQKSRDFQFLVFLVIFKIHKLVLIFLRIFGFSLN